MSMNLSSVLAALSSYGVPLVTGTNIQVVSPQGCTSGLAGPLTRDSTHIVAEAT